jgi:hypothetical protein
METYIEALGTDTLGVGFQCNWLGKGGEKRCFVMEKRRRV